MRVVTIVGEPLEIHEPDLGRAGVADDIRERFLEGEEKFLAKFRVERVFRQVVRDVQAAGDGGEVEQALRVRTKITRE